MYSPDDDEDEDDGLEAKVLTAMYLAVEDDEDDDEDEDEDEPSPQRQRRRQHNRAPGVGWRSAPGLPAPRLEDEERERLPRVDPAVLDESVLLAIRKACRVELEILLGRRKQRPPLSPEARRAAGERLLRGRKCGFQRGYISPSTFERVHGRPPGPKDWYDGKG